jgi:pimeloyl-ACP methyl ester carboxylesterase
MSVEFVLIPGAGGSAFYWHRVTPLLQSAVAQAMAVELPANQPGATLADCTEAIRAAIGSRSGVVLVASSMGAFTAPDVALVARVSLIVLVNPMTPRPGETPGEWWEATGQPAAFRADSIAHGRPPEFDPMTTFLHDVEPAVIAAGAGREQEPVDSMFSAPPALTRWPDVRTEQITGRDDRFFPVDFQLRLARERLGIEPDVIPGGHLLALSRPEALARKLLGYAGHL